MPKQRIGRPNHATVIAYVALVVALSGTAVAASGKIGSNKIKKGGVKTKNLVKQAVKKNKIDKGAVETSRLDKQAVTQGKLAPESVGNAKLQTNSVTQKNLQNGPVGTAQLLSESVGDGKLKPNSVIRSKVTDGAVNGAKVEDGSLGWSKVAQLVSDVTIDFGPVGACAAGDVTATAVVPGIEDFAYVLVIPGGVGWDLRLLMSGYAVTGADTVTVRACDVSGEAPDPGPVPVRVLGFA